MRLNTLIRRIERVRDEVVPAVKAACEKEGIEFYHPSPIFCTDNAAMIGVAGYYEYLAGNFADLSLNAIPNLRLGER